MSISSRGHVASCAACWREIGAAVASTYTMSSLEGWEARLADQVHSPHSAEPTTTTSSATERGPKSAGGSNGGSRRGF